LKAIRPGFEVALETVEEAKFRFLSQASPLVSFAQDSIAGIAVVLMGHLYYQDELRSTFPSVLYQDCCSNAEQVLKLYQKYKSKSFEHLEGEFAVVVFDQNQRCLFALRDPLGSWPLYWACHKQSLWVSTNLQHLTRQIPHAAINLDFLASFLMFPYAINELNTEQTSFNGIQRVLPGHLLALTPTEGAKKIWSWDWLERIRLRDSIKSQEVSLQFNHLFQQSVQERSRNGRIASHLSGGMDSSSVVCIAQKLMSSASVPRRLITLSLVYQMRSLARETDYIQMVLEQGGAIDPYYVDGDQSLDFQWFTEEIPNHDEPYPALFHFPMEKVLIDLAAKLGVNTILTGTGAELVVAGNRLHVADLVRQLHLRDAWREARRWAKADNQSLWAVIYQTAFMPLVSPSMREGIGVLLSRGYGRWPQLGQFSIPPWIHPDFARKYNLWSKGLATIRQLQQHPIEQSMNLLTLNSAAGNWASWYLGSPLGTQISHPFLDPRLITYCLSIPREIREVPGVVKPVLQEAMRNILPEPIRTRQFKGDFNEVYWTGLSHNLHHLENMVNQSQISELGILNKQQLIQALRQHVSGIGDVRSGSRISRSLALIAWFDQLKL